MSNGSLEPPQVGEYLETLHPKHQLRRKVRITRVMAIVESITYSVLIPLMLRKYVLDVHEAGWQTLLRKVTAYSHGIVSAAYGVMILDIFRVLGWSKKFTLLSLAGPPGAIIAYRRLRRQPLPDHVDPKLMLFR